MGRHCRRLSGEFSTPPADGAALSALLPARTAIQSHVQVSGTSSPSVAERFRTSIAGAFSPLRRPEQDAAVTQAPPCQSRVVCTSTTRVDAVVCSVYATERCARMRPIDRNAAASRGSGRVRRAWSDARSRRAGVSRDASWLLLIARKQVRYSLTLPVTMRAVARPTIRSRTRKPGHRRSRPELHGTQPLLAMALDTGPSSDEQQLSEPAALLP